MAKKYLKRILPDQATLERNKLLRCLGPWVLHPAVWTLHRRSVAGGVAAGLFCGLFPAPFQMLGAAIASFLFHWNLPVAVFTTLYTNPITFIPLYLLALKIGIVLLNAVLPAAHSNGEIHAAMGWPLVIGVFTLATLLAIIGYIVTRIGWNIWVRIEVAQRRRRRSINNSR